MTIKLYCQKVKECLMHRYRYYVLCAPIISDREYDRLEKEIRKIEKQHPNWVLSESPSTTVGSDLKDTYPDYIREFFDAKAKQK